MNIKKDKQILAIMQLDLYKLHVNRNTYSCLDACFVNKWISYIVHNVLSYKYIIPHGM